MDLPAYDDGTLIYKSDSDGISIEVRELGNFRWMHFGSHAVQSALDLRSPSLPQDPYSIAMLAALLFQQQPAQVLNLGVGGGSIERFFSEFYQHTRLTSVELSDEVIRVAQEYFFVDKDHRIIQGAAEHFVSSDHRIHDIIFCDIFTVDEHPAALSSSDFYEELARRLSDDGILVVNLLPKSESELLAILQALRGAFPWGYLLEFPDHRNIEVFCFKQQSFALEYLEPRAQVIKDATGLDLRTIPSRLISLNKPK